jgi:hypothetical protein
MLTWFRALDRVLRGDATSAAALKSNDLDVPVWGLCVLIDLLGLLYGLCMGVFDLTAGGPAAWKQTLSCMMKVPALFLLTLLVTLPSLYVFNAMVGSRLTLRSMVRLLVAALAVMLAVLSSIGPIVAFFSFTTTSYSFMILLNVVVFGIAGCLGMAFLLQSLHRMTVFQSGYEPEVEVLPIEIEKTSPEDPPTSPPPLPALTHLPHLPHLTAGPLERMPHGLGRGVRGIFQIWVLVFALVGTQMAWVLSPFLGHPHEGFVLFRPTSSNFFQGVYENLNHLTGGSRTEPGHRDTAWSTRNGRE